MLRGDPLSGHGLEPYAVNLVTNSPWIREIADINRVRPQFREESWAARRDYVLPFHDGTVECVARDANAWTVLRAMDQVVRQLSSDASRWRPRNLGPGRSRETPVVSSLVSCQVGALAIC